MKTFPDSKAPPGREEQVIILQIIFVRKNYAKVSRSLKLMIGRWFENIAGIEESTSHECGMLMSHKTNEEIFLNAMVVTDDWMDLTDLWHKFAKRFNDRFGGPVLGMINFEMCWMSPSNISRKVYANEEKANETN